MGTRIRCKSAFIFYSKRYPCCNKFVTGSKTYLVVILITNHSNTCVILSIQMTYSHMAHLRWPSNIYVAEKNQVKVLKAMLKWVTFYIYNIVKVVCNDNQLYRPSGHYDVDLMLYDALNNIHPCSQSKGIRLSNVIWNVVKTYS